MTLGSLFDGLGGWQLAAVRSGIKPLWSSEIDKYCCQISKRHFPDTLQLGDINLINDPPNVDIITAGSPCQNLSIAGNRSGIHGKKSSLFFKAVELVRRVNPKFFVWENVTGAFSSNGGNDFQAVLQEISREPIPLPEHGWANAGLVDGRKCQIAWRTLDAQYWGVPQRRKRIFLVADFTARRAAQILFEPESLCGDSPTSEGSQQTAPARLGENTNCSVFDNHWKDSRIKHLGDIAPTVSAMYGTGGNNIPLVAFGIGRDAFNQGKNAKFNPTFEQELQPPHRAWCRRLCHAEHYQAAHPCRVRKTSGLAR